MEKAVQTSISYCKNHDSCNNWAYYSIIISEILALRLITEERTNYPKSSVLA